MSGLLNSTLNESSSNLSDSTGRPFATSFSSQTAAAPGFHHSGGMQGLHNIHGNFNIPNMPGSLVSWNAAMNGITSSGIQQPGGNISSGRFASTNVPVALSQISHGQSGVTNRGSITVVGSPGFSSSMNGVGGAIPGISSSSIAAGNRNNSVPGLGASPTLGNVGPRITSSMGNIVGGGNIGRSISSGGLSVSGFAPRMNLSANSGSGNLNLQGHNRFMSGMLQHAPQMIGGMIGNSYPTSGGFLSQSQMQVGNNPLSSMGILNDLNSSDTSPFDLNDFPQLSGRPNSAGGPQGQIGSLRKQGVSSIVQQNQEFSIQNEDFPALPGFKGGNSDFPLDLHQKDQLHENVPMMQSQHFHMARSSGFSLGGSYPSNRQQQQQHATSVGSPAVSFASGNNQDLLRLHGSDIFSPSHVTYHSQIQNGGSSSIGLRPGSSQNPVSGMGSYEQIMQQYQQPQNQSQFRLQHAASQSYRDQSPKSVQGTQTPPDPFGMLGLLSVIRANDPDLTSLALGIDLTTLGLNLSSTDNLHKAFASPWSDEPAKGEPEFSIPSCYLKPSPKLQQWHFSRFQTTTLFYIFYSMPKDEAQLYAASELYMRKWYYHKDHKFWFTRVANTEPLVKTSTYERGSYHCFDPNAWEVIRKDNLIVQYDAVEKKPSSSIRPQL